MPNVLLSPTSGGTGRAGDPTDPEAIARVLLEKSSLLIYITDLNYKVVLFNRAAREATGYDTATCPNIEALLERFYPDPGYRKIVQGIHDGWTRNEHIRGTELVVQCKDGNQRTISWSTSRLKVGRRSSTGYIAMGVDVTTRRSLEQWVSLLQRSLQHLREGVVLTDPSGHILAWSEGAYRLLGHEEKSMQGRLLSDLYLRAERAIIGRTVERGIEAEGRFGAELELEKADGGSAILDFQQVRLDGDGGLPLALLTVLSEPESKGGRPAAEAMGALEGKIGELTRALEGEQAAVAEQAALVAQLQAKIADGAGAPAENPDQAQAIEALRGELAAAHGDLERLKAENAVLGERAEKLAQDAAGAAEKAGAATADARQSLGAESSRADNAEAALAVATASATAAAAKASEQADRAAAAEAEAGKAAEALAAAEAALAEQTQRAEAAEARLGAVDLVAKSASGKVDEAEARATKAQEEVEALRKSLAAAEAEAEQLRAKVAELEAKDAAAAEAAGAAGQEAEEKAAALAKELEESQAALAQAEADAAEEQARREEAHRAAVQDIQGKAAAERKTLEEQLSKDILAAEERAETERTKLETRFAHEKAELEQAAVIARAEAESEWRGRVAGLEEQLSKTPPLQGYVAKVGREAFVAADGEGRIIAWSAGAAALDGRPEADALGKRLHKDALALQGVNWKKLFGKVVVSGRVEGDYELVTGGGRRAVRLVADLVRDPAGRIVGVAESIEPIEPEGSLELHGRAAYARIAAPLYRRLEEHAGSGLSAHRGVAAAVDELRQVASAVLVGASAAELEAMVRDLDLEGLVAGVPGSLAATEKEWRGLRATAQDLARLTAGVAEGGTLQIRWNELVERCLSVVEASPRGPAGAERVYGERESGEVRGELVVPLLLALLSSPTPDGSTPAVATSVTGDRLVLDTRGPAPDRDTRVLLDALAAAAGGSVEFGRDGKVATASVSVPRFPVVEAQAIGADSDDDLPGLELEAVGDDEDGESTSVGKLDLPGVDEDSAADTASPAVLASGSVDMVEEDDGGDLLLMLGEDSAVLRKASPDEVAYVPVSATGSHPRVTDEAIADAELEGAFSHEDKVSASVRDAAEAMDAFAARQSTAGISDLQTGPMPSAGPSPEVLEEMQATDAGEDAPKSKKSKGKKRKGRAPKKK